MGCKILRNPETSLPIFEFTLVFDEYAASGARPLVWLFNKVTGEKAGAVPNADDDSSRVTRAVSRITMVSDGLWRNTAGALTMQYHGIVRVSCRVPNAVLRMLPMSKESVQQKVSTAMVGQLRREGTKSMQKIQSALTQWLEQNQAPPRGGACESQANNQRQRPFARVSRLFR
uniref:Uncharacterized protein n=1 Tax=Craspedostauros australis TaxID=1486917 RepID=A0A7R9ZM72_9STRA